MRKEALKNLKSPGAVEIVWKGKRKIWSFSWTAEESRSTDETCFMITCCVFGIIKFCQLEVQCNFPVYLTSCIKYKLILPWHVLLSEIFVVLRGFLKINLAISCMINIETSSICKNCLQLWFGFSCCLIHFYWRKSVQPLVFFSYLTMIIFFMLVLKYLCNK